MKELIDYYVESGCRVMDSTLGFQSMPRGYALMLNSDETHYFWLCDDGRESCIHWDKWAVRRGAISDKRNRSK